MMKQLPWREMSWALGFVALLAALYVGSYASLISVDRRVILFETDGAPSTMTGVIAVPPGKTLHFQSAKYRVGGENAKSFFGPIHQLDRRIRSGTWDSYST